MIEKFKKIKRKYIDKGYKIKYLSTIQNSIAVSVLNIISSIVKEKKDYIGNKNTNIILTANKVFSDSSDGSYCLIIYNYNYYDGRFINKIEHNFNTDLFILEMDKIREILLNNINEIEEDLI